ncbi:MAG: agmatine deiminase family protein, partial [Acidobacteria bacterium]|nr:agmatine deiminase family protein [Acidobacteriota bacterium]
MSDLRRAPSRREAAPAPGSGAGFRMPAEWEPNHATWLVWPHARADWEVKTTAVEWCYADIARNLVRGERVAIVYHDEAVRQRAERRLRRTGVDLNRIDAHMIPTNRSWIRDCGPIFVVCGSAALSEVAATDWRFNGWARYRAWRRDDALPRTIVGRLGMRRFEIVAATSDGPRPVALEGGSIDVNGQGLLLTTEQCLLGREQARNPDLSREEIERILQQALGVERVLWLGGGIAGDDTHGHVDDVARFVNADTVVAAVEPDASDENHAPLADNLARLRAMCDLSGRPLHVVTIPMPRPLYFDGERLPASYLNFYIGNDVVLVPTFNDPSDRVALGILAGLFPAREVVGIHAGDLILGLGAVHCVTQQQPRGRHASPAGNRAS